jgi:hypothetical protein
MIVYTLILILVQTSFHPHGHHQVLFETVPEIYMKQYLMMPVRVKTSLY